MATSILERQKAAEEAFAEADVDGSGTVELEELAQLMKKVLDASCIKYDNADVEAFVKENFAKADEDQSGGLSFDEVRARNKSCVRSVWPALT